ncbi:MAG: hypothetical protein JXR37_36105 [Kiritimatiellae bacterium]|nr:hypothetical protein [Kiritimatiellia bacterium]
MEDLRFRKVLEEIVREDPRYHLDAYLFVREALEVTVRMLKKPEKGPARKRHVSGQELLEGIRTYALDEYGPMAMTVLRSWGVGRTEDFGAIVFKMVEKGILGKTEEDKLQDFANGYDFEAAFVMPFRPAGTRPALRRPKRPKRSNSVGKSRRVQPGDTLYSNTEGDPGQPH